MELTLASECSWTERKQFPHDAALNKFWGGLCWTYDGSKILHLTLKQSRCLKSTTGKRENESHLHQIGVCVCVCLCVWGCDCPAKLEKEHFHISGQTGSAVELLLNQTGDSSFHRCAASRWRQQSWTPCVRTYTQTHRHTHTHTHTHFDPFNQSKDTQRDRSRIDREQLGLYFGTNTNKAWRVWISIKTKTKVMFNHSYTSVCNFFKNKKGPNSNWTWAWKISCQEAQGEKLTKYCTNYKRAQANWSPGV